MKRGVAQIFDEMTVMPEFQRLERIRHFQFSVRVFERNAQELLEAIELLAGENASLEIAAASNRSALHAVLEEIMRRLHNFVAAVLSLIDHARVMTNELYSKQEFPDYKSEVESRFVKNPLAQFVKDLRQYAQHYKLPGVDFKMRMTDGVLFRNLILRKQDLSKFAGWSSAAKRYLLNAPSEIDLREVVESYAEVVRDFYAWMGERQTQIHAGDIAAVEEKKTAARRAMAKDVPRHLEAGLKVLRDGVGDIRGVFAFGLGPQDHDTLADAPDDAQWVKRALDIFGRRFGPLPPQLVVELQAAAAARV